MNCNRKKNNRKWITNSPHCYPKILCHHFWSTHKIRAPPTMAAMWAWMRMYHRGRRCRLHRKSVTKIHCKLVTKSFSPNAIAFLPHTRCVETNALKQTKRVLVEFNGYEIMRILTGVYVQIVSCWVFQLSHVDRTITSLWKLKFFTFTVPINIDSASLIMTFSNDTFLLSNFCLLKKTKFSINMSVIALMPLFQNHT